MARTLIINADDLGYDPAVTKGILRSMREGVVTSATFMVNTPYSVEAAREAKGLALGLHLNLARHPPVAKDAFASAALLPDGGFDEPRAAALPAAAVEQEVLAQLDLFAELLGAPATHLDVHKHLHSHPSIFEGLVAAAKTRGLPVRSITPQMRAALLAHGVQTNDHFIGDAGGEAYWTMERLVAHVAALEDGVTELMCHPGYAPSMTKSGYSAQREVELATFVDPRAREVLRHVALTDFRALHRR